MKKFLGIFLIIIVIINAFLCLSFEEWIAMLIGWGMGLVIYWLITS